MAGHLGAERVTVQNLQVVKVDAENNLIAIKGAIPGPNGGIVVHPRQRQGVREGGIRMPKVAVFDMAGKEVGKIELSDAVFGIEPNAVVMHDVVVNYLANQRQGTQSTLTRTEVSGGGKKPWRQKGTGHAQTGFHPRSPVDSRRHRTCARSRADYRYYPEQEGAADWL